MRGKGQSKRSIPARCARCGAPLRAIRDSEHALIRCERCGMRVFSYYAAPPQEEDDDDTPPSQPGGEDDLLDAVTPQARAVYQVLRMYITRYGCAPTVREMARALNLNSTNAIAHHLDILQEIGLIERLPGRARAIRLPYVS